MESFKHWYMGMYWKFDDLFVVSAKFLGITYHEFVLISLCIVWPLATVSMMVVIMKLWRENNTLKKKIPTNGPNPRDQLRAGFSPGQS